MNTTLAPPPILDLVSALGDETRTRILVLLERGEFNVSELCRALQLPQPTVSRHLRTLAEDGWVTSRSEGLVRGDLRGLPVYAEDAERAQGVLADRRRRSAEFFAASADRWDELRQGLFGSRAEFLPLLGLLDPEWVVGDLGIGTGGLAATLAPYVHRVVGVDRSEPMLDAARERLAGRDDVDLRLGELEDLPIEDGELDVAVLSLVLHYVLDPEEVLAEAARVLRPAGRLLAVDMRAHERGPAYARDMGHVWPGFTAEQITGWLEAAGFQRIHVQPLPPDPAAEGPMLFLASGQKR
ncbi:MAG: metalloregulator ArsR/SmtB family transcription factor [Gemmatimonadota bacterium]